MSLLNDASLVMIPSGYKDTKLYSVKPTNGDGDFTFSRGSNLAATRINSEGLIEKGRENLLLQSNSFSSWSSINTTETGGQTGYDGSSNAWLITKSASGARVQQSVSISGVQTLSAYVKAGTLNWVALSNNISYVYFDVANGLIGTEFNNIDAKIQSVGNGWYRCSVTYQGTATDARIYPSQDDNDSTGTSGNILVQDAQLEVGLVSTDVITTTTTTEQAGILEDMPRLDYSGGATCGHLLLEPQRSNVITQSEYFGAWTESGLTITDNNATSPEGVLNAAKLTLPSGSAAKRISLGSMPVTAVARSYSFFVKSDDITAVQLVHSGDLQGYARFDISTGVVGSTGTKTTSDIQDYGNGWYRCIANFDSSNAFGSTIYLYINDSATGSYGGSTSAEGDLFVYGAQYEEGSYPTSYIPTYGSSVTRSAEHKILTGNLLSKGIFDSTWTFLYDNTFVDVIREAACALVLFEDAGGSNSVRISLNSDGSLRLQDSENGVVANVDGNKILCRFNGSTIDWYVDGSEVASDSVTPSNFQSISVDDRSDYTAKPVKINKEIIFPTALTDAECIDLTTI